MELATENRADLNEKSGFSRSTSRFGVATTWVHLNSGRRGSGVLISKEIMIYMIKVIIERTIKEDHEEEFHEITSQLRASATPKPGYISGETWVCDDDPCRSIVISIWADRESWENWENSATRKAIAAALEPLLSKPVRTTVCRLPSGREVRWDASLPQDVSLATI